MNYNFNRELTEDERMAELTANLATGNHKSATEQLDKIQKLLHKDVTHGFALPIPIASVPSIKGAMVQPIGLTNQFTLQADGSRVKKGRLTHHL
mmetsp:Transcript_2890/g.4336  ORF Transcript_2890/g.4336 Transcript_2890/m.4336 type:complete len:94 (+) Transcript_2890:2786-3067(+)